MFVDDYNVLNIIPYHSASSLVLTKYIDLSFLFLVAANKVSQKAAWLHFRYNSKMHSLICGDIFILTIYSLFLLLLQHSLWKCFLVNQLISFPDMCDLVCIIFSVPTNSGWVDRAYSSLEMVCQKQQNRLSVENLRELFLLSILILSVMNCLNYADEAKYFVCCGI